MSLLVLFFFSGAAALLFQTLWFRLAGLVFGSSAWASSLVLSSFMAGLALGNLGASRLSRRLTRPIRTYAVLELVVGASGLALVALLPSFTHLLAPLFRRFLEEPAVLNPLRFAIAFVLLLVPTTAMGATLPVLVPALARRSEFGPALGRLYGWNTLGAVAGALVGETVLMRELGLLGTGLAAAAVNGGAALCAFHLARRLEPGAEARHADEKAAPLTGRARRILAAGALCGGALLAFEILWFRFVQLFARGTTLAFAVMLAVVLLGIALGALVAGKWLAVRPRAFRFAPFLAAAAALCAQTSYTSFDQALEATATAGETAVVTVLSLWLMLPTSLLSGILFTLLGRALEEELHDATRTTGVLTVANTAGAMAGALVAGFLLLPGLGVERSLFAASLAYAAVALLLPAAAERDPRERRAFGVALAVVALLSLMFPFGLMHKDYLARVVKRFNATGARPVAFREGLTETIVYMQQDLFGMPLHHQLITNGYSMSGNGGVQAPRYMRSYVYWPLAVHPRPRRALMISFGVGTTAKALTDARELEAIEFVDISKDVLEVSRLGVHPPETSPLDDPRVKVHVEDGRFFLLTTPHRYDIITAEPPPPIVAGIVNLYSREYFTLVRDRLDEGGIATYWLPVYQMDKPSALSTLRGFCDVFEDCSLWAGAGLNWMMVGTRGARGPVPFEHFTRLWRDETQGPSLREIGLETPEHLGATFVGDAAFLRDLTRDAAPLTDDRPYRLRPFDPNHDEILFYRDVNDAARSRERFAASPYVRALWPEALLAPTLPRFDERGLYDSFFIGPLGVPRSPIEDLFASLTGTRSEWLPLVLTGSHPREQAMVDRAVARGESSNAIDYLLAVRTLARRQYAEAASLFEKVQAREPGFGRALDFRILSLCLAGRVDAAQGLLHAPRYEHHPETTERPFWSGLRGRCGAADLALQSPFTRPPA
jgi:spermidine synthase